MLRRFALPLVFAAAAFAQQGRGTILGTVTDTSGAAVPAASVVIVNTGTNAPFRTQTNAEGFYTAPGIPVGDYAVTAELQGFKKVVRSGIRLEVDQRAQVDMVLEIGSVTEQVEVVGAASLVDTASATVGKVVEGRRISDLPVNGRSAFALMLLAPAVKPTASPNTTGFNDRGQQLSQVSINGGPTSVNSFVVDGGNNNQSYYPDINANPAVDSVEEFKVQSNVMSAEFGFTLGGVVNVVTKSGTNAPHGTLYHFLRNSALDARNAFALDKVPFTYNQYGGAIGGPVFVPKLYNGRDKTFFFFNYEEYRYASGSTGITSVIVPEFRRGDFSQLRDARGVLIPIYDPNTTRANPNGAGFVRDPFPGNTLPAERIDPVARNVMQFYPLPNRTPSNPFTNSDNFYNVQKSYTRMRQYTARGDQRIGSRNQLMGRYMYFQHFIPMGKGGLLPPELRSRVDDFQTHNVVVSDTHTFSPTMLNDFRVSVARQYFTFTHATLNQGWPQKLGLPANVPSETTPVFGIQGWDGDRSTGVRAATTIQFLEALTVIRGGHTLKFGVDHRALRGNNTQKGVPSGSFNFAGGLTGNPQQQAGTGSTWATFLLGDVSSASLVSYLGQGQVGYSTSGFFQDDWKVARRLTLNVGLRYDYQSPPAELNNGTSNFDPFGINPETGLPGRTTYAMVDYGRTALQPDKNNWNPRVGIAWDMFGRSRTVLRAGYAIFYASIFNIDYFGNTQGFATTNTAYNPPNNNGNFPAFKLRNGFPFPPIAPQGAKLGPSPFLSAGVAYDQAYEPVPMSQQWNLSLQQHLKGGWLLDATYTANRGAHLIAGAYDLNQMDPRYFQQYQRALSENVPNPYAGRVPGNLGGAVITRQQSLRPFPWLATVSVRNPHLGNSIYHALLLSAEKRLSRGFAVLASFTGGKLISDNVAVPLAWFGEQVAENGWQNGKYNRAAERSVDPTDVSRRLTVSGIWELPFAKNARRAVKMVAGGWQVNTITMMQNGLPLTVRGASNFMANRPNSTGRSAYLSERTQYRWFDTTAFVNPPDFTYGNVGRTIPDVRGPGIVQIDLSLIKDTQVTERVRAQFRAESFNFPNTVNLGFPDDGFSAGADGQNRSATFGTIRSARSPRIVQFGLKLIF